MSNQKKSTRKSMPIQDPRGGRTNAFKSRFGSPTCTNAACPCICHSPDMSLTDIKFSDGIIIRVKGRKVTHEEYDMIIHERYKSRQHEGITCQENTNAPAFNLTKR